MRDYIRRGTARPSFITSLELLDDVWRVSIEVEKCDAAYAPRAVNALDVRNELSTQADRHGIPPGLSHAATGQPAKSRICLIVPAIDR
jgi:hypothetical protein